MLGIMIQLKQTISVKDPQRTLCNMQKNDGARFLIKQNIIAKIVKHRHQDKTSRQHKHRHQDKKTTQSRRPIIGYMTLIKIIKKKIHFHFKCMFFESKFKKARRN